MAGSRSGSGGGSMRLRAPQVAEPAIHQGAPPNTRGAGPSAPSPPPRGPPTTPPPVFRAFARDRVAPAVRTIVRHVCVFGYEPHAALVFEARGELVILAVAVPDHEHVIWPRPRRVVLLHGKVGGGKPAHECLASIDGIGA